MVDTVGFNDKFWFDYKGHPHTEKLHTIERYTRTDLGNMTIDVTIDDRLPDLLQPTPDAGRHRLLQVYLPGRRYDLPAYLRSRARARRR